MAPVPAVAVLYTIIPVAGVEVNGRILLDAVNATRGGRNPLALVDAEASTCSLAEDSTEDVPTPICAKA